MKQQTPDDKTTDTGADIPAAFDFAAYDQRIVYVKPVDSAHVPGMQGIPAGTIVFTVHLADGTPVAVMGDRASAFAAARQYNMEPVSIH